jgi:DNA-binding CsgD family transcriptional regulator
MKILSDYGYDLKDISVDGDNNNLIAKIEKIN